MPVIIHLSPKKVFFFSNFFSPKSEIVELLEKLTNFALLYLVHLNILALSKEALAPNKTKLRCLQIMFLT